MGVVPLHKPVNPSFLITCFVVVHILGGANLIVFPALIAEEVEVEEEAIDELGIGICDEGC